MKTASGYLVTNWHRYTEIWQQIGCHVNLHRCHNVPGAKPRFDGNLNEFGGIDFGTKTCRFDRDRYMIKHQGLLVLSWCQCSICQTSFKNFWYLESKFGNVYFIFFILLGPQIQEISSHLEENIRGDGYICCHVQKSPFFDPLIFPPSM